MRPLRSAFSWMALELRGVVSLVLGGLPCFAIVTAFAAVTAPASAQAPSLQAGAFAIDVTPVKFPISLNGGFADRLATMANDPVHARCLVLDDGNKKLVLVVVDSCMVPRTLIDNAKALVKAKYAIPPEQIVISATHTHSAPTLAGVFQSEPDEGYVRFLTGKIAEGIGTALGRRQPAQIGWGVAKNPDQLFNRRWKVKAGSTLLQDPFGKGTDRVRMNPGYQHADLIEPAGPIDPVVSVLSVQTRDGRPLALFANYSLHYVGGYPQISADYYGAFAERVGNLLGAKKEEFMAAMSNGTSGDVNNVNFAGPAPKGRQPGEQIRVVAESVARSAVEATKAIRYRHDIALASAQEELELGVRKPAPAELERARRILDEQKGKKSLVGAPATYARETLLMAEYPDKVKLNVQAHRVGDLAIAAIPCEVFTEIGLAIKKANGSTPTFTISLANGYNGYLPTPAQHELGGYETWRARSSYLEVNASVAIEHAIQRLMNATQSGKSR